MQGVSAREAGDAGVWGAPFTWTFCRLAGAIAANRVGQRGIEEVVGKCSGEASLTQRTS